MTDELILKELYSQSGALFRLCLSILKHKEDAEDIVAEAIVKVWEKRNSLHHEKNLSRYLFTTAKHLCFDKIKSNRRLRVKGDIFFSKARIPSVDIPIEELQSMEAINRIINLLPHKQRLVIQFRMIENMAIEQIATIMNEKFNTVEVHLSRARKTIREQYAKLKQRGY